jgi:hypothetical protein
MKEKLLRLLRAVLRAVAEARGWRQEGTPPTSPPPAVPPRPEPPREDRHHG